MKYSLCLLTLALVFVASHQSDLETQPMGFNCKREGMRCTVGLNQCCNLLTCSKTHATALHTTCMPLGGGIQCQDEGDMCMPGVTNCCSGLTCKKSTLTNDYKCRSILDTSCKKSGETCMPGLTTCCLGLTCKPKLIGNGHTCKL